MSATTNRQLIEEHFAAKGRLDRAALESQFTSGAKWWPPVSGAQRGLAVRPVEGGLKLAEMLTTLSLRLYAPERSWAIELLAAEEQTGAAQVRLSTRLATSGEVYENTYVYFFRFADGKIAEVWEHLDTAYAFALFDRALSVNSAPSPVDLIKKHFESKRRCDQAELNKEIAEDVRWWPPASAERKGVVTRPIEGRQTMVAHLATEMYEEDGRTWTITHLFGEGDQVCARARLRARVAATGDEYDNEYSYVFRVENGQIAEVWEDFDTAYAFDKLLGAHGACA
jgi:ketosteroid isomerase-like protein